MSTSGFLPTLSALFAVVVWGATFVATKIALAEVSPATIVWIRFGIGVLILGAAVLARRQFALPSRSDLPHLALLGFLGVTFHQWLQATGMQTTRATNTAWIVATIPVFTALLGWLLLREKMGWLRVGGIAIAAFGVLLIVSDGNLRILFTGGFSSTGDLLIFISAVNWAAYTILSRRELARHPAARMMFYVMLFGWLFTCIWLFSVGPGMREIPALTFNGWLALLLLGIFGSGLAYIAWYDALREIPASRLGVFINIEPLVTILFAAPLLGEPITMISLAGGAVIIFGVWLVNRQG
ncbi:MAG: putative inner membrane transporter YedA [Anaerolineales bacterium]|nr:putative inner membrane transporter YedA [Anaerolineales bacterium]